MKIIIELEQSYGHPDNRPSRQELLQAFAKELPKAIAELDKEKKYPQGLWLQHFSVYSIRVE